MKWILYGGVAYLLYRWWQGQQNVTVAQPVDDSGAPLDFGGGVPLPMPGGGPFLPPSAPGVPIPHPSGGGVPVPAPRPGALVLRTAILSPTRNVSGIGRI